MNKKTKSSKHIPVFFLLLKLSLCSLLVVGLGLSAYGATYGEFLIGGQNFNKQLEGETIPQYWHDGLAIGFGGGLKLGNWRLGVTFDYSARGTAPQYLEDLELQYGYNSVDVHAQIAVPLGSEFEIILGYGSLTITEQSSTWIAGRGNTKINYVYSGAAPEFGLSYFENKGNRKVGVRVIATTIQPINYTREINYIYYPSSNTKTTTDSKSTISSIMAEIVLMGWK